MKGWHVCALNYVKYHTLGTAFCWSLGFVCTLARITKQSVLFREICVVTQNSLCRRVWYEELILHLRFSLNCNSKFVFCLFIYLWGCYYAVAFIIMKVNRIVKLLLKCEQTINCVSKIACMQQIQILQSNKERICSSLFWATKSFALILPSGDECRTPHLFTLSLSLFLSLCLSLSL